MKQRVQSEFPCTTISFVRDSTGNINNEESDIVNNNNDVTITDNDSSHINCNKSSNIHDTYKVNCTELKICNNIYILYPL